MKTELERVDTALLVDHGIAVKTGGNNPLLTRARQLVTCQLQQGETVVGHIGVE